MQRNVPTLVLLVLFSVRSGQIHAQAKAPTCADQKTMIPNPDQLICVDLQGAPNSMEPVRQPAAIRVDNRKHVFIRVSGMSPLDSCSITKTQTPTTETNPFQTLLTTVSGLGSISFAPGAQLTGSSIANAQAVFSAKTEEADSKFKELDRAFQGALQQQTQLRDRNQNAKPPIEEDPVFQQFQNLYGVFRTGKGNIKGSGMAYQELKRERGLIDSASWNLVNYLARDYRGPQWSQFNPMCLPSPNVCGDPLMSSVTDALKDNVDASLAVSQVQGNLDILTGWQGLLHKKYETANPQGVMAQLPAAMEDLEQIDRDADTAKALVSLLNTNLTAMQTSKTALRTAYLAAEKLQDNLYHLQGLTKNPIPYAPDSDHYQDYVPDAELTPILLVDTSDDLFQNINIAPDRKDTLSGTLSCVSTVDMKTATTDTINYSILYQDLPMMSLSTGVLLTFQQKEVIGTSYVPSTDPTTGNPTATAEFGITSSARAQIFPMAFINFRAGSFRMYHTVRWGRTTEERLLVSGALSAGIGVNSNSGTNQPEFFAGPSLVLNKILLSPGVHIGRVQRLGNGFTLGGPEPTGFMGAPPLKWQYRPAFSLGISFRVAPW